MYAPAVAPAKSREQRVATSFRLKMRKIFMNYHTRGQRRKNYNQAQYWMIVDDSQWECMIVGGQTEARAQLSSTIIDYHEPFDQGFRLIAPFLEDRGENFDFVVIFINIIRHVS